MLRQSLAILIFFIVPASCFCQRAIGYEETVKRIENEDSLIIWKPERKLKIEDFQGKPDSNSIGGGASACNILPIFNYDSTYKNVVLSYFNKKKSWIKLEYMDNSALKHEQGHFDIAEMCARKMMQLLKNVNRSDDSAEWKCYYIHLKINKEYKEMQKKYDLETKHHNNIQRQKEWDSLLDSTLNRK